jgi:hypothetical protein
VKRGGALLRDGAPHLGRTDTVPILWESVQAQTGGGSVLIFERPDRLLSKREDRQLLNGVYLWLRIRWGVQWRSKGEIMYPMAEFVCSFCESAIVTDDLRWSADSAGSYCGACTHRMGLDGDLILPCGLCQFPVMGDVYMINGHDYEYCETCHRILRKMGF